MLTAQQVREFLDAIGGQFYVDDLNKIPEPFRELFVANKDGHTHRLMGTEDVLGLKATATARERERDTYKTQLGELKSKYEGIDPDEFARIKGEHEALKDKTVLDSDGMAALRAKHVADAKEAHERERKKLEAERDDWMGKADNNDRRYRQFRLKSELQEAFAASKPNEDQLPDLVRRGLDVFELDDQDRMLAYRTNGEGQREQWTGADGVSSLSPKEFVEHLREKVPSFWPSSSGSGAGGAARRGNGLDWRSLPADQQIAVGLGGSAAR